MITLSETLRTARLQIVVTALEGGSLTLYTEPQPAAGTAITTQTALITLLLPETLSIVNHTAAIAFLPQEIAATGNAVWGRLLSADDAFVADGACGLVGDPVPFQLKTTALEAGELLATLTAFLSE